MTDARETIVQLSNGCVCCTVRDDLRATLRDLAASRREGRVSFDRVVLETTGLADPGPIVQTFFVDARIAESYTLDAVITLVDAKHGHQQLDRWPEARRQIGFADRVLVTKPDLVDAASLVGLQQRLVQMNPRAAQREIEFGNIPWSDVFDLDGFKLTSRLEIDPRFTMCTYDDHAHEHDASCGHAHLDDVRSFVYASARAFDAVKLQRFMGLVADEFGESLLRYKGVLHLEGSSRKVIMQGIHQLMSSDLGPRWPDLEARQSRIVFIGVGMPEQHIRKGLDACLL